MQSDQGHDRPSPRSAGWLPHLSPAQQLGYGCLLIVILGTSVLYGAGILSMMFRPSLRDRAVPTPTVFVRATATVSPTLSQPTVLTLPPGKLLATPTQAPIPTRELPTLTPTVDLTNPAPITSVTVTRTLTLTPTRRVTSTNTPRP